MRGREILVVAAWLLFGCATRPALGGPPSLAADSTTVADAQSSVRAEERSPAAPSAPETTPSVGSLGLLRSQVGRRVVRVNVGQDDYEFRHVSFDSSGVVFSPGGEEGMPLWAGEDASPLSTPISWDRIECIRVRHSYTKFGAVTGALLGSGLIIGAVNRAAGHSEVPGLEWVGAAIQAPLAGAVGAYVGAIIGQSFGTWPIVWRRVGTTRNPEGSS